MKKNIPGTNLQLLLTKNRIGVCRLIKEMVGGPFSNSFGGNNMLSGEVALVTGAYKGIGLAIAARLLKEGAKVIITGRNINGLEKAVKSFGGKNITFMVWDISDFSSVNDKIQKANSIYGKITILVNNAGVTCDSRGRLSFESMDTSHIHYVHNINTIATKKMCESYLEHFTKGTILNIISNTCILPALDAYQTSKWALYSYTKALSERCGINNCEVTINGLCPGPIKTDMTFNRGTSMFRPSIPNKRIGLPEEIAELALLQIRCGLSGQNGMITVCDGGESL